MPIISPMAISPLAQKGTVENPLADGIITTKNGDYIVVTTGGDMILTVNGFVPLNALRTTSGDIVKTKNLDFITI